MNQHAEEHESMAACGGFVLTDNEFEAIRRFLYKETGITLNESKRDMVCARLAKRLRHYEFRSFADYYRHLQNPDNRGEERQQFINCMTTNKTDFFREAHHFDFLRGTVIPQVARLGRRVRIWSAGCSTGEEPYTMAMILHECCPASQGWDVRVLASDIDSAVLAAAETGVYEAERLAGVPPALLHSSFLRGAGTNAGRLAVRPELRKFISFRRINLMDEPWAIRTHFDAIFCRNVMIYFDVQTQRRLLERFAGCLVPGGYLFLGHSENLHSLSDRYSRVANTVYQLLASPDKRDIPQRRVTPVGEPEHTLILGDVKAVQGPAVLKTLLGSCVSACVYDPIVGAGGMNHFSLPGVADEGVSARYGAHAMELLITAVMKQGGDRSRLRAKVFGGAKVLRVESECLNIGRRNAEFVLEYLKTEGIEVANQCLGGDRGMLVRFRPFTGKALVKPLTGPDLSGIVEEEERFSKDVLRTIEIPAEDSITLF